MSVPLIAERADIHKSCKTIEVIVNVLNDYCEAANAMVSIQKKLAKALKDSASAKVTVDIAANAFGASATIFEALADVDNKFAKFADKECDNISTEVKKWFKRLAKEEKAHDERLANANAKIKQAGQIYERKAKKNPRDAQEEHARYMALLSTLGPEVTKDKYDHGLLVTSRHTAMLYSIAACLSRVADAEWNRNCEGVRRFAPTIGTLGQWRALCEGGWIGSIPKGLTEEAASPNVAPQQPKLSQEAGRLVDPSAPERTMQDPSASLEKPAPEYSSRGGTPTSPLPPAPPNYPPSPNVNGDLQTTAPLNRGESFEERSNTVTSFTSLANFPAPPTHFPIPPPPAASNGSSTDLNGNLEVPNTPRPFADTTNSAPSTPGEIQPHHSRPPSPGAEPLSPQPPSTAPNPTTRQQGSDSQASGSNLTDSAGPRRELASSEKASSENEPRERSGHESAPYSDFSSPAGSSGVENNIQPRRQTESPELTRQYTGVATSVPGPTTPMLPALKAIERSDTGKSNGSVVANLRDRYSTRATSPPSPTPKDVPRLPLSVGNLATRYESSPSSNPPVSPGRSAPRSSVDERRQQLPEPPMHMPTPSTSPYHRSAPSTEPFPVTHHTGADDGPRHRGMDRGTEYNLREQEHHLRLREQEINLKAKELELERAKLLHARALRSDIYVENDGRYPSSGRPVVDSPSSSPVLPPQRIQSSSSTNLATPLSSSYTGSYNSRPQLTPSHSSPAEQHSPSCGCETCSVAKYRTEGRNQPSPRDLRPPEQPLTLRPDKPKGWIRRLSMPVMNAAFSSESSKKGISSTSYTANTGYRNSMAFAEEDGRMRVDSSRNRSSTNLSRR